MRARGDDTAVDVRSWHKPDKPTPLLNVRYRMMSGKHLLPASISGFDHIADIQAEPTIVGFRG
jgi:hypothetical protein